MNRRQLLKGMIAMPAVALAAKMNVPEVVAEEMQEEMARDLTRTVIQVPGKVYEGNQELWVSSSRVREVYGHYVSDQLKRMVDDAVFEKLNPKVSLTVRRLVNSIDQDLSVNDLEKEKVILEMPKVEVKPGGLFKEPMLVLKAGAEQKVGLLGSKKLRVGYIQESLVDRFGKALS